MVTPITALILLIAVCDPGAWQQPQNLGDNINSAYNDWYPVIAGNGSYTIFVSERPGGYGGRDIWISYKSGEDWGAAQNLGASVNTAYDESAPSLAENDTRLYFYSTDPSGSGGGDIWYCPISGGVPGARVHKGPPINSSSNECCPLPSKDGGFFYFCSSRSGGYGGLDFWISENNGGTWGTPYNAGDDVNSPGSDCPRWISDDGDTVVLTSTAPGGYGNADVYHSTKSGGTFAILVSLGPVVNSSAHELGAGFADNGAVIGGIIYFGSGRSGGYGGWDIWRSEYSVNVESTSLGSLKAIFR